VHTTPWQTSPESTSPARLTAVPTVSIRRPTTLLVRTCLDSIRGTRFGPRLRRRHRNHRAGAALTRQPRRLRTPPPCRFFVDARSEGTAAQADVCHDALDVATRWGTSLKVRGAVLAAFEAASSVPPLLGRVDARLTGSGLTASCLATCLARRRPGPEPRLLLVYARPPGRFTRPYHWAPRVEL